MRKLIIRLCSIAMSLALCFSLGSVIALAAGESAAEETETVWNGADVSVDVTAGKQGYTHLSVYAAPYHAYEISNHMISASETNSIPQTLVMIDATKDYTWTPSGIYSFADSNYEVLYCCDAYTGYNNGIYYKRINLEDSGYYTAEEAAHIRAIITNAYPYISLEQMKQNLAADGFVGAEELDRAEILAAVQGAVWYFSNGEDFRYKHTFNYAKNPQWGGVMHDYTAEMAPEIQALGKRKFLTDDAVGNRINSLMDYLKALDTVYAQANEIVVSGIEILGAVPVLEKDGVYTVALRLSLNNSGTSSQDSLTTDIWVGDTLVASKAICLGTNEYQVSVEAKVGDVIRAVVSGKQILPKGVYFYEPEGGRDISQSLVGVAMGETDVYAEAAVSLDLPTTTHSTGDILLKKVDENGSSLTGAAFELFRRSEGFDYFVNSYEADENGELRITDLLPGEYVIRETCSPSTYHKLNEDILFSILEDGSAAPAALPGGVTFEKSSGQDVFTVINTKISTSITLSGIKYLDGTCSGGFQFALMQDGVVLTTAASDENGIFCFPALTYTEAGTYTYQIAELADPSGRTTHDDTVFTVTVTVTREGELLTAAVSGAEKIVFYNDTLPKTGDPLYIAIAAALTSLLCLCSLPRKRH